MRVDRARRRELKHAGVLAARQARGDLASTIAVLDASNAGDEGRQLASRLAFAVGSLYGAEVGEPEAVRDRLREASGVLSGVLARLSEPGVPRALDDAGASIAKCLAILYPARAGLERELEASASSEASTELSLDAFPLSSPVVPLPAREMEERPPREKRITSPGVAPPSSPVIPITQLARPDPEPRMPEPEHRESDDTRPGRIPPSLREQPTRVSARTMIRGTDDAAPTPAPPDAGSGATRLSRPPAALLREATPETATTSVGRAPSRPPAEGARRSDPPEAMPLKRKRKRALELVPDADEGLVERSSGSPLNDVDRRTTERVSLSADIGLHSATQFFTGLSGDVSRGGLFVATWAPLPLGTEVTVSFVLPGGHQVTTAGHVAWLKEPQGEGAGEDAPGMGVRFATLSEADRRAVESFLARRPALFHDV